MVPTQAPILITPEEPRVLVTVGGVNQSIFFWTLGQLSLCSLEPRVCFPPDPQPHNGAVWMSQILLFQSSFKLQLGLCVVFSCVSDHAGVSLTPSGEGYTEQGPRPLFS